MSEQLSKMKRVLSGRKGHVTLAINRCKASIEEGSGFSISQIREALTHLGERFDKYLTAYYEADEVFHEECREEFIMEEHNRCDAQRMLVDENITLCNARISVLEAKQQEQTRPVAPPARPLKLPPIQLPKFAGDQLEYEPFWDQFRAQVDLRSDIEPVSKLAY